MGTELVIKSKMSNREFESCVGSSTGGREPGDDPVPALLRLIGKAVLDAMVEDWTAESLERYWTTGQGLPVREVPDYSISAGSALMSRANIGLRFLVASPVYSPRPSPGPYMCKSM